MPDPRREAIRKSLKAHEVLMHSPCQSCHENRIRCVDQLLDEILALLPPAPDLDTLRDILSRVHGSAHTLTSGNPDFCAVCRLAKGQLLAWASPCGELRWCEHCQPCSNVTGWVLIAGHRQRGPIYPEEQACPICHAPRPTTPGDEQP